MEAFCQEFITDAMKTPPKPLPKKPSFFKQNLKFIVAFLIGSAITVGILMPTMLLSKQKRKNYKRPVASAQAQPSPPINSNSKFIYINPLSEVESYRKMNMRFIDRLEGKVKNYIDTKAKQNGVQVAFYFRDLNTDKCFGIDENKKFGPASLMKVPTMIAILKKAETNPEILNNRMFYKGAREGDVAHFISEESKSETPMVKNNSYSISELLEYMIVNSDNEATILLLDFASLEYVEQVQKELGYVIPSDIPVYGEVMTIKQYSAFFRTLYNASYLNREYSNYALELLAKPRFVKGIKRLLPPEIMVSHKFGSYFNYDDATQQVLDQQLHHFGIVYYPDKPFIIGFMTKAKDQFVSENVIAEISRLVYDEVDKEVKTHPANYLQRDIE